MQRNFVVYTCNVDSDNEDVERCFVPETTLKRCYKEWDDIDLAVVKIMKEKGKRAVCKLHNLIKNESYAKKLWGEYFLGQQYLDFEKLSLDDCIFFFLNLEDNMALKSPGIHKVIKGHYDL